jgi:hypothetical protein
VTRICGSADKGSVKILLAALLLLAACDAELNRTGKGRSAPIVEDTQVFRAQLEMRQLAAEIAQHHALRGEWPADWRTLKRSGKDPWGGDYQFEIDGEIVTVFSAGPDGEFGTDDDVGAR